MDTFTRAYVTAALSMTLVQDEDGDVERSDEFSEEDISADALREMIDDCRTFQEQYADVLADVDDELAGEMFYYTRNRHGIGFWDRGLGDAGNILTSAAHVYGTFDLMGCTDGNLVATH